MAMKLSSIFFHWNFFLLTSGSNSVVKKQEVATQATPMETLDACMLAKNATQCKANRTPQPQIFITALIAVRWILFIKASTANNTTTLAIILYHTRGSPPSEMSLPKMPVHPAKNTAICRMMRVTVFSFIETKL